jgi:hypothetical protein
LAVKAEMGFPNLPYATGCETFGESLGVILVQKMKRTGALIFILVCERDDDIPTFAGWLH